MPHTQAVCVSFFIGVGSRYETEAQSGISHFIEHLLFKGTPKRPTARAIAEAIEGAGGILNGGTDKELTVYWCKVAKPHLALALDVLADMLVQYLPGSTVVAIAGNIQHQEVVTAVNQTLGDWTTRRSQSGYIACKEQIAQRSIIETRDTEQVHLCLALPGLSLLHPKRFTLDLLNIILGEGMSSRLFTEIRDRLGLAYSIHSYVDHLFDSGSLIIYAGVEPKDLKAVIDAILEQLHRLTDMIPESELSKAKELSKGHLLLRMEDSRNVAGWAGGQEILTQRILNINQVKSIVDAITAEELKQIAQELIVASQLRLAVVGPITGDEPLEELLKL